jgi:DNA polymerase-3 subunit epsilon
MNWAFLKNNSKEFPPFWETYLAQFSSENKQNSAKGYVVFDCETTGLSHKNDRILSIGAVKIITNRIEVGEVLNVFVQQELFKPESVPIHGIIRESQEDKIVEAEAIIRFLDFIKNSTIVGHNIWFDIEMINKALDRLELGKLKNDFIDTDAMYQKLKHLPDDEHYSLDELCDIYKIRKSDRHTACGDAYLTALLFLKLKKKLNLN